MGSNRGYSSVENLQWLDSAAAAEPFADAAWAAGDEAAAIAAAVVSSDDGKELGGADWYDASGGSDGG